MSRSNTNHSYGSVAKTFHWLTALLIITLIALGIIANGMAYDTSEQLARKAFLFSMHKTLGVTMFFVALARIGWAFKQPKPNGLHPERKAESWLAETIHWLLYGSLVIVPLTGWIHHAASTGFAPIWWPFGQNLPFVAKSESTSELFAGFHIIFERVLAASILLHVAGALKHHFVDKDATLRRMWFGASKAPKTTGEHSTILPLGSALIAWAAALFIGTAIGVFEHGDQVQETAALETVASDWAVQSGAISIKIDQFGSEVTGSFEDWTAAITFDPDTGLGTTEVTIAITSLTLGSVTSQALGPDFFDTATFPTAVFTADLTPTADGHMASGTLQIRDKTLPIEMPFALSTADGVTSMQAMTTLNRLDFDIGKGMGDESSLKFPVDVQITLTATPN
ncbi:MAG: cytochrome b561/polyisoprenoid-binding protein YceI [Candidatus Azotimanducaceae bacterium]|jgi:cytochrome b561/polyisoprenoid-binding protein YceI